MTLKGTLLIAGATGALGQELVRRLAGRHRFDHTVVLAREPIRDGLGGVQTWLVPDVAQVPIDDWPRVPADTALVLFEPPRLYYDRERALWTPTPAQLPALAGWLRACGVHSLAVVLPHVQGRLPEALKHGLASLDEQAVAALGFDRVLLVRTAQKPGPRHFANLGERLAAWMLSITRFMVPASEQPVRASKVAELVDLALRLAPPGVHVAAPELVWRATQGDLPRVVAGWVNGPPRSPTA
ncbi:MAG TPA: hypothetical protein VGI11_01035, partial [Variovorax sp.]